MITGRSDRNGRVSTEDHPCCYTEQMMKVIDAAHFLVDGDLPPGRRPCRGMLWVHKTEEDRIESHCPACGELRYLISNWRETLWADGPLVMPGLVDGEGTH